MLFHIINRILNVKLDQIHLDAFKRLKISQPYTIFDSKQIFDDSDLANTVENFPLFFDNKEVSGSGTSTLFNVNQASLSWRELL